jgi:hypothetical protein
MFIEYENGLEELSKGTAGPDSDVDVMVTTPQILYTTEYKIISLGYDLYLEMGALLSVKIRSEENFEENCKFHGYSISNTQGACRWMRLINYWRNQQRGCRQPCHLHYSCSLRIVSQDYILQWFMQHGHYYHRGILDSIDLL